MFEEYVSNHYLRAGIILITIFIVVRLIAFIIEKVISKLTSKTKTTIDDKIVQSLSKPITSLAFLFGLRIALIELPLAENLSRIFTEIVYSLMIVSVAFLIYGIIDALFLVSWRKFTSKTKSDIDDSLASLVSGLLKAIISVFTLIYILEVWGVEIGPFLAGLGIGGIAIAFALQSSLSNIFGGVSMILDKSVRVGDVVNLYDGTSGTVHYVGIRSTRIKTFDNHLVIVPNGKLSESMIQNIDQPEPKQRITIPFSVAYGSNVETVKKLVLNEIKKIKHFSKEPAPVVRFMEMGDSALIFKAFFYIDNFLNKNESIDDANTRIYNILNKNKIEIPFPQMDVHLKKK